MGRRGFTLIEVMVVLSILAIIAILGYNFFGSTMKDALVKKRAAEINRGINILEAAWEDYVRRYNADPVLPLNDSALFEELELRGGPSYPFGKEGLEVWTIREYNIGGPSAAADVYVSYMDPHDFGDPLGADLCLEYNNAYSATKQGLIPNGAGNTPADYTDNQQGFCYYAGGTPHYYFTRVIQFR